MKYFPNIEKSAFRPREYVGYAAGSVWRIRKHGCGGWEGRENGGDRYMRRATLEAVSEALTGLGATYPHPSEPRSPAAFGIGEVTEI